MLASNPRLHQAAATASVEGHMPDAAALHLRSPNQALGRAQENQYHDQVPLRSEVMGSTSNAFALGVARSALPNIGVQSDLDLPDDGLTSSLMTPCRTPRLAQNNPSPSPALPLMSFTEMNRLINLYEEEVGTIYPFLDIEHVKCCAQCICHAMGGSRPLSIDLMLDSDVHRTCESGVDILKMVIAIALVIEGHGLSEMARRLVGEVERSVDKGITATKADIRGLKVLTLMVCSSRCTVDNMAALTHRFGRAFTSSTVTKRSSPGERLAQQYG